LGEHEDEGYWFDDVLTDSVEQLLKSGHFPEAQDWNIKALIAKGKAPRGRDAAATCQLLSQKIRVAVGGEVDFIITVYEDDWNRARTALERQQILIHELHHVDTNRKTGNPRIRDHDDDFCTRQAHDKYSQELAKLIPLPEMLAKSTVQKTMASFSGQG
jgi:hypothetical protein